MLRIEEVHVIRHKCLVEGLGIRQVAREMGVDPKTVRKYLKQPEPRRVEKEKRRRPVLEKVGPRIDELLEEWKHRIKKKHRITSPRVHRKLREEGYEVSERTIRSYLAERRRRVAEVYIPLVHRAGEEAQIDFFEVTVEVDGVEREVWKFLMRLMYSGRDFVHLYDRCDQVSFLDAHVRAFSYFGGVVRRAVYDNLSAAVKRIVGLRDRELTERFAALASHYLFEPCFARPGEGHDKGGVEGRGKGIRWQHMTPIVRGKTLDAISEAVLRDIERAYESKCRKDGRRRWWICSRRIEQRCCRCRSCRSRRAKWSLSASAAARLRWYGAHSTRCRRAGRGSMRWPMWVLPTSGLCVGVMRWCTCGSVAVSGGCCIGTTCGSCRVSHRQSGRWFPS